ncbi:MAG: hypothetical protein IKB41_01395 [Clostridia bacterium]|nr:hypothetical protein [Clostridia bacterium]
MRKQLKVLLLVAMVAVLFVMAMIVGSATETEVADGAALVDAVANAEEGDTIKLTANVTLDAALVIDKPLTIDGGDFTITSTSADYIFKFGTDGEINIQDVTATSTTAGAFQIITVNGTYILDDVNLDVAGLILNHTAAKGNVFEGGYILRVSNCVWTSSATNAHLISHPKRAVNEGVEPEEGEYPCEATFTKVTVNANTIYHIFKLEGARVIIDGCTVNNANTGRVFYADTFPSYVTIQSEAGPSLFNVGEFVGCGNKAYVIEIGREGENDDITVNATASVFHFRSSALPQITINGGTYNRTGDDKMMFECGLGTTLTIKGATFTSTGAAPLFNGYSKPLLATYIFENCTFDIAGKTFASLANAVVLTSGCTGLDANAMTVKYGGADYKLYAAGNGFENSAAAGAGLYVDSTVNGSGLRFETVISKAAIDNIVATLNAAIAKKEEVEVEELDPELAMTVAKLELKFYTIIAPVDYVAKAGGVFTKAALDAADITGTKYVVVEAVNSLAGINAERSEVDAAGVTYSAALVNLKSYTRGYAAVSMIEYKDNTGATVTYYGAFSSVDNVRSAKQVADNVIADAASDYNVAWKPVSDPKAAVVDKYATGIVG